MSEQDAQAERWTASRLATLLCRRYAAPEWLVMFEVRSSVGFVETARSADALAFNMDPSRGLELHGVEIKVSRSDWTRELKKPEKAEEIMTFCDRWRILAAPKVVDVGELPATWGLIEPRGGRLHTIMPAPKLDAKPFSRGFFLASLRRVHESYIPLASVEERLRERYEAGKAAGKLEIDRCVSEVKNAEGFLAALQKVGIYRIDADLGEQVAPYIKRFANHRTGYRAHELQRMAKVLRDEAAEIDEIAQKIERTLEIVDVKRGDEA